MSLDNKYTSMPSSAHLELYSPRHMPQNCEFCMSCPHHESYLSWTCPSTIIRGLHFVVFLMKILTEGLICSSLGNSRT